MPLTFHAAPIRDVPIETLYRILWLRSAVFVVEQEAAYDDIDGRDLEPGTVQCWAAEDGMVLSTLRILVETRRLAHRTGGDRRVGARPRSLGAVDDGCHRALRGGEHPSRRAALP
jgi:ElaA protein